jgi:hypothetical protein
METRQLIVTHHAPDLDAVCAVWLLKKFNNRLYADSKVAFVNAGDTISEQAALMIGFELHQVTHVDTGLGRFDHHQPEQGHTMISAASLVYDHLCQEQPDLTDDVALRHLVDFVTEIDHFHEIYWPEADSYRYIFMIHELIRGLEYTDPHNDHSQLHFGLTCLDSAYGTLKQQVVANLLIEERGQKFQLPFGQCLAIETSNEDTVKLAQKKGLMLVICKDPKLGHIRIKARPDAPIDLKPVADKIKEVDNEGSWYYHPSGKMLINGSRKKAGQKASPLTINEVKSIVISNYSQDLDV